MDLWFARDGNVPIRDQLATQLLLAIASGELPRGKRLPSTRALARRFRLNANTVSAAYQQLESLGWVESIRGSGVYVRAEQTHPGDAQLKTLDRLVLRFLPPPVLQDFPRRMSATGLITGSECARRDLCSFTRIRLCGPSSVTSFAKR